MKDALSQPPLSPLFMEWGWGETLCVQLLLFPHILGGPFTAFQVRDLSLSSLLPVLC